MHKVRRFAPWVAAAILAIGGVAVAQEMTSDGTPPNLIDGERTVSLHTGGTESLQVDEDMKGEGATKASKGSGSVTDDAWADAERRSSENSSGGVDESRSKPASGGNRSGQSAGAGQPAQVNPAPAPAAPVPAPAPVAPAPVPHYWDDDDWDDDDWGDDWDDD